MDNDLENDEELFWSIHNILEFVKTSGVENCDCPNCQIITNSISHCQHYVDTYKAERRKHLN